MKKKVLLLGASGMLGHQVYYHFVNIEDYVVIPVTFRHQLTEDTIVLDLNNKEALATLIKEQQPDIVINCVGVLIKGSGDNPANAIYINAYLPHLLVQYCDEVNAKLIHISTDCVFSGSKGSYLETDPKDGLDVYAKTKALGEVEKPPHLTLRTSIVGPELKEKGEGLLHWFLKQEEEINGFTKAYWSGVTTLELAKVIAQSIEQDLRGLYHITNGEKINKHDLLILFKIYSGKGNTINSVEGKAVDKSLKDTRKELLYKVASYEEMIWEQFKFMVNHPELYAHYLRRK